MIFLQDKHDEQEAIKTVKHDEEEALKTVERKAEKRARRANFITIMLSILGGLLTFAVWLNTTTHNTDLRLQKIESALGINND